MNKIPPYILGLKQVSTGRYLYAITGPTIFVYSVDFWYAYYPFIFAFFIQFVYLSLAIPGLFLFPFSGRT